MTKIDAIRWERLKPAGHDARSAHDAAFLIETDAQGTVRWTDAKSRAAIVGISLAEQAPDGVAGVDEETALRYAARERIHEAWLRLTGDTPVGGLWQLSAIPLFDPAKGEFIGYRGSCKRPSDDAVQTSDPSRADAVRQVVHELRTPLNAVSGFAQIIEQQMFGPVPHRYRARADAIVSDVGQLMALIDDLDAAAKTMPEKVAGHRETGTNTSVLRGTSLRLVRPRQFG